MPVQPQLFPDSTPAARDPNPHTPGQNAPDQNAPQPQSTANLAPIWLQRLSLFVLVIFCIYLGGIVTVLPWITRFWDHNLFFTSHPLLWSVLRRGPTRGVVSGLGLLDVWVGISEAIHYRDQRQ